MQGDVSLVPFLTGSGGTISSSAAYSNSGNTLASTTDALGKVTTYGYNAQTNVLEWVQYPEDTAETRTEYTYDSMYRMATAGATTDTGLNLSASYTYTNDLLTRIQTPTTQYNFTYGDFGLRSSVKVGTQALATYHYNLEAENGETPDRNYDLDRLDYGNGDRVNYTYDSKGRLTSQTYEDGDTVTYQYDNDGALAVMVDSATGITTRYYYDFTGRTMKYTESATGYSHSVGYEYDDINNLTAQTEVINGVTHTTSYTYDQDNRVTSKTTDGITIEYTYDALGRITKQVTKNGNATILTESYTYNANSSQIRTYRTVSSGYDVTYTYTYDGNGNILSVSDGNSTLAYQYDSANQIIRENNTQDDFTRTWTYDASGNILSKQEYDYSTGALAALRSTTQYSYGDSNWKDKLTAYNGISISYDAVGNPTSYRGKTLTWEHGRELASLSYGATTWTYTYDASGMRTKRINGSSTYTYVYNGSQLAQMTVDGHTLTFTYDASGTPMTLTADGTVYYYLTNTQGDVTGILNASGNLELVYEYDAWGQILYTNGVDNVLAYNPLRYRGYVYDQETGLYYVSSRYYDPEIGRFISPDTTDVLTATPMALTDKNLYAYCDNNPVIRADHGGDFWNVVIGAAVGAVVGVAGQFISDLATSALNGKWTFSTWQTYVGAAVGGAFGGAILGGTGHVGLANAVSGFVTTGVGMSLEKVTGASDKSWTEIGVNAVADGAISYGLGKLPGVKNVTKGRNNMSAVYRSGLTKLRNKTVSHMSKKVIGKGLVSGFVGGLAMDGYYGVKQYGYNRVRNRILRYAG